jgi:hypothetical protein
MSDISAGIPSSGEGRGGTVEVMIDVRRLEFLEEEKQGKKWELG